MFNKFLQRLPNEVHKAEWYPFDEKTQKHLTTGEVFFYAFGGEDINSQVTVMRSLLTDATNALPVLTSSTLDFHVGDKVEVRGIKKLITDIGIQFQNPDYELSVDFQPNVNIYYRTLILS